MKQGEFGLANDDKQMVVETITLSDDEEPPAKVMRENNGTSKDDKEEPPAKMMKENEAPKDDEGPPVELLKADTPPPKHTG